MTGMEGTKGVRGSEREAGRQRQLVIVIRRHHSLDANPAISGPETAFCVFARDFTVSFVRQAEPSGPSFKKRDTRTEAR